MKRSPRAFTAGQQEIFDKLADSFLDKQHRDAVAKLVADLTQTRPPLPLVDLINGRERSATIITFQGYMAGLSGGRRPLEYICGPAAHAWTNGWQQGREHRARTIERDIPFDVLTAQKLKAVRVRMEPVPW